jgi:hypothetical protein
MPSGGDWIDIGGNRFNEEHDLWTASMVHWLNLSTGIPPRVEGFFNGESLTAVDAQRELNVLSKAQRIRQDFGRIYHAQSQGSHVESVETMLEHIGMDRHYAESMDKSLGDQVSQHDRQHVFGE